MLTIITGHMAQGNRASQKTPDIERSGCRSLSEEIVEIAEAVAEVALVLAIEMIEDLG